MNRRKPWVVLGGVALCLLAWRLWASTDEVAEAARPLVLAAQPAAAETADLTLLSPALEAVADAIEVEADSRVSIETPVTPPTVEKSITDAASARTVCEEKYRNATMDQLIVASHKLNLLVKSELVRIGKEIGDAGYESNVVRRAGETPEPELPTARDQPVNSFAMAMEPDLEGNVTMRKTRIDGTNYPEFHALNLEAWWLDSEIRHRGRLSR